MRAKKLRTKVVGFKERGVCYEKIFKDFYFP